MSIKFRKKYYFILNFWKLCKKIHLKSDDNKDLPSNAIAVEAQITKKGKDWKRFKIRMRNAYIDAWAWVLVKKYINVLLNFYSNHILMVSNSMDLSIDSCSNSMWCRFKEIMMKKERKLLFEMFQCAKFMQLL